MSNLDELFARAEALADDLERPRDGKDGKDADPAAIKLLVDEAIADMPKARDGKDADPSLIRSEVERAIRSIVVRDGADGEIGPMPKHEWQGTQLRFEQAPGVWGKWTDLQGPPGPAQEVRYVGGVGGAYPVAGPPGPAGPPGTGGGFSYMPSGW